MQENHVFDRKIFFNRTVGKLEVNLLFFNILKIKPAKSLFRKLKSIKITLHCLSKWQEEMRKEKAIVTCYFYIFALLA
jgi:hypothetical protein